MAFTFEDIGGCACGCPCSPCAFPAGNLHASLVIGANSGGNPLVYSPEPGGCRWDMACRAIGVNGWKVEIHCSATCVVYLVYISAFGDTTCSGAMTLDGKYETPLHCHDAAASNMTLGAFTCSPLNVPFTWNGVHPGCSLTITP